MRQRLEELVRADGTELKRSTGNELVGICPLPEHDDTRASFYVNTAKQVWNCRGCGASGNVYGYLLQVRRWAKSQAVEYLKQDEPPAPKPRKKKGPRIYKGLPYQDDYPGARTVCTHRHAYTDKDGNFLFYICRFQLTERWSNKCLPFVPHGPEENNEWVSKQWARSRRPLYRLARIDGAHKEQQFSIVEGEKCVEIAEKAYPKRIFTTWVGGGEAFRLTDWTPVYGHKLFLIADQNPAGRKTMRRLAKKLAPKCPEIRLVLPPGDTKDDIEQWLEKGGPGGCKDFMRQHASKYTPEKKSRTRASRAPQPPDETRLFRNDHFEVLGNSGDLVTCKIATHRILKYPRTAMGSPSTLIALAGYDFWSEIIGEKTLKPANCLPIGSALIRKADKLGQIDVSHVMERGLTLTPGGRYVFHLGDRLLVSGEEIGLGELHGEPVVPIACRRIELTDPATVEQRRELAEAVLQCRWASPIDGKIFMGWVAISVAGGGLVWRPNVWLTAPSGAGKSWLLKKVVEAVHSGICNRLYDVSVAGLSRMTGAESLPVLLEESEGDKDWVANILDVIRVASGGDGARVRALGTQDVQIQSHRFSSMAVSVKLRDLEPADRSRFAFIGLTEEKQTNWPELQERILKATAPRAGFLTQLIHDAPALCRRTAEFTAEMEADGVKSRLAHVIGPLMAGWEWWSGEKERLIYVPPYSQPEDEKPRNDSMELLLDILGLRFRISPDEEISLLKLLTKPAFAAKCEDYGVKVRSADGMRTHLHIAIKHPSLRALIDRQLPRWRGVDRRRLLLQIPEAFWHNVLWFSGVRIRSVGISIGWLKQEGIDLAEEKINEPDRALL